MWEYKCLWLVVEGVLPRWASGVSLWMFRGGAAKLMQHNLAPVEEEDKRGGGEVSREEAELEGQPVIRVLLAAASCLPCFHIPPYAQSESNVPKDPVETSHSIPLDYFNEFCLQCGSDPRVKYPM